jgi:hypothetical protein
MRGRRRSRAVRGVIAPSRERPPSGLRGAAAAVGAPGADRGRGPRMTLQGTAEEGVAARPLGWAWLLVALAAPLPLFWFGFEGLAQEWARPEYRFKAAVPALAMVMFLQVLRSLPPAGERSPLRWPGVVVVAGALMMALLGNLMTVDDFVFVAMILWVIGLVVVWLRAAEEPLLLGAAREPLPDAAAAALRLRADPCGLREDRGRDRDRDRGASGGAGQDRGPAPRLRQLGGAAQASPLRASFTSFR